MIFRPLNKRVVRSVSKFFEQIDERPNLYRIRDMCAFEVRLILFNEPDVKKLDLWFALFRNYLNNDYYINRPNLKAAIDNIELLKKNGYKEQEAINMTKQIFCFVPKVKLSTEYIYYKTISWFFSLRESLITYHSKLPKRRKNIKII